MRLRTLVVDDSPVVCRLVSDVLNTEPDLEVVGTALDGATALTELQRLKPDVVLLDVEMSGMSGIEVLSKIRPRETNTQVVMYSAVSTKAATATFEALALGAHAFATKPTMTENLRDGLRCVRETLVPIFHALRKKRGDVPPKAEPTPTPPPCRPPAAARVEVLTIGSSIGGPNALTAFLSALPASFPVPVVVVQHLPRVFTKVLAERLTLKTQLVVHEARHGDLLVPGNVWLAPGDKHMRIRRHGAAVTVVLDARSPPINSCRPAIDLLFDSVATAFGSSALAVILTGMGQDGLRGCEKVAAEGGYVIAQDQRSSVVWGIPGAVVEAGLAHAVLPLSSIAGHVLAHMNQPHRPS